MTANPPSGTPTTPALLALGPEWTSAPSSNRTRRGSRFGCLACGKHSYTTRRAAKRAAKINHPGVHMVAYRCGTNCWHYANMLNDVIRGRKTRDGRWNRPELRRSSPTAAAQMRAMWAASRTEAGAA